MNCLLCKKLGYVWYYGTARPAELEGIAILAIWQGQQKHSHMIDYLFAKFDSILQLNGIQYLLDKIADFFICRDFDKTYFTIPKHVMPLQLLAMIFDDIEVSYMS